MTVGYISMYRIVAIYRIIVIYGVIALQRQRPTDIYIDERGQQEDANQCSQTSCGRNAQASCLHILPPTAIFASVTPDASSRVM